MKVALVKPPISGHGARGIGFYGQRLFMALDKLGIDISWVNLEYNPFAYQGYDIVHFPYCDIFWPTLPPFRNYKTIVTLHDVIPLKFPHAYPFGMRARVVWPLQKILLKNVDAVITDSLCSKNDIQEFTGINKTYVTYLAADDIFKPLKVKRKNYVLYVGGGNYNKNVKSLVLSCKKLKMPLILVGNDFIQVVNKHAENIYLSDIQKEIDGNLIKAYGFVETTKLVKLYNGAKVYVQPSIYEGFGLPILEALSCGTPVICGNNSSLHEIGGDAVTYADVTDVNDLTDKINKIKKSGKEISQASKFSWEKTAQETLKVYESI